MALFVIGDPHLSLGAEKSMDVFSGWQDYVPRMEAAWREDVGEDDTVVVAGDFSWGMSLEEALEDFKFLARLPGKKILLKGNHDYYWTTVAKMDKFLFENGITGISFLNNNSYETDEFIICGSRGWAFPESEEDFKIVNRETGRIRASLASGKKSEKEKILFLHYPPVSDRSCLNEFIDVMTEFGVKRCYYGHLHSAGHASAFTGEHCGIRFELISADYLKFRPKRIERLK